MERKMKKIFQRKTMKGSKKQTKERKQKIVERKKVQQMMTTI